ncbi:MAG: DUF429 domain-containing protein [Gammaproteobacteria bacterium]
MKVYGIDFTSRPTNRKAITCAQCGLVGETLTFHNVSRFTSFDLFEAWLNTSGPWTAGLDFPFGQSQRFIRNIGWPESWAGYVALVNTLSREEFRKALDDYRAPRETGDKEHQRSGDKATGAISPQKLYGVPVGLMFFEGAKRLLASGVHVPGLVSGDQSRRVVEAYPGVLARRVTRNGYKTDARSKQTAAHAAARQKIVEYLTSDEIHNVYGVKVNFEQPLEDDPSGDLLDSVLCAVQAAWAWKQRDVIEQHLTVAHRVEGWIADPLGLGL